MIAVSFNIICKFSIYSFTTDKLIENIPKEGSYQVYKTFGNTQNDRPT